MREYLFSLTHQIIIMAKSGHIRSLRCILPALVLMMPSVAATAQTEAPVDSDSVAAPNVIQCIIDSSDGNVEILIDDKAGYQQGVGLPHSGIQRRAQSAQPRIACPRAWQRHHRQIPEIPRAGIHLLFGTQLVYSRRQLPDRLRSQRGIGGAAPQFPVVCR